MKKKVLFLCVHNSARSQMAEEYLIWLGGDEFEVESAGFDPGVDINPLVEEVMQEEGIDLSFKKTQGVDDLIKSKRFFGYIITVCNRAAERECPTFPGAGIKRIHWDLPDPEDFTGSYAAKLEKTRALRDKIKALVVAFIESES